MKSVWLQERRRPEVDEYLQSNDVIYLPVGSTEQHGQHLPLGNDAYVAIKVAEDAAAEAGVLVAPPIWYGWTPHHMAYAGTVTIGAGTLTALVADVCISLVYSGFKKVIIFNGHRETQLPSLKIAATRVRYETGAFVAVLDPYYIGVMAGREMREKHPGMDGHAAGQETAHLLALYPDLVEMSEAVSNVREPKRYRSGDPFTPSDRVFVPATVEEWRRRTEPAGTAGDPTCVSREEGLAYHRSLVRNLVEFTEDVKALTVDLKRFSFPV